MNVLYLHHQTKTKNMKTLHSIQLATKNNKKNGFYLYIPIVKIGNDFYRCKSIKTKNIIKACDLDVNYVEITSLILPIYYNVNNISL